MSDYQWSHLLRATSTRVTGGYDEAGGDERRPSEGGSADHHSTKAPDDQEATC